MSKLAVAVGVAAVVAVGGGAGGVYAYAQTRTPEPDEGAYVRTVRHELPTGWQLSYDQALNLAGDTCKELDAGTSYRRLVFLRAPSVGPSPERRAAEVIVGSAAKYLCPEYADEVG